ncbi:MAG: glucose 1-dehydrogenase [Alphaproteobacteria bacterium]|nr:glucose 1-dehydrogenase [Alphaproteobacteria bacterium]
MGQLDGRVAIVTGSGRGIGKATALTYGKEGAKVVVASRTPATTEAVARQIRDAGGTAIAVACDVGHKDQIRAMVDKAVEEFGRVDILVNNAQGFGTEANPQKSTVFVAVQDTDDAELEYTFRTGALATLWAMQAVYPHMKKQGGGKIINFASAAGMTGDPGNTSYNVTKEAIRVMTRTAAREWGPDGIQINTVNPFLRTDAWESWEKARPDDVKKYADSVPMKRLGDPMKDGGPLMVFLASDANSYMTGHDFNLDGGWEIHA